MSLENYTQALKLAKKCRLYSTGKPKTDDEIAEAEQILGITLSRLHRKYCKDVGRLEYYGNVIFEIDPDYQSWIALENIEGNSVALALNDRREYRLPNNWIPIYNFDDGYIGYLDYGNLNDDSEPPVIMGIYNGSEFVIAEKVAEDFGDFILNLVEWELAEKEMEQVFREAVYRDHWWHGSIDLQIWGEKVADAKVLISGKSNEEFSYVQRAEFMTFLANKERIIDKAETRIYEYYQNEIVEDCRDRFDTDNTDPRLPDIHHKFEMSKIMRFKSVTVGTALSDNGRYIGLVYDCAWNDHGVGVKIVNGEVVEVGYQDIVL